MTTDEPDEQLAPVSPEDEARIRALLSGARVTAPMPADVAARLDDALVGLAAERTTVDPVPAENVIPITRTRRHRVVTVLGAAAAVGVFGLGITAVLNSESGSDDAGSASDSAVDRGADDDAHFDEAEAASPEETPGKAGSDNPIAEAYRTGGRAFAVRSGQLSRDLARLQARVLTGPTDDADFSALLVYAPQDFDCQLPSRGRGLLVGVRYDGSPAFVRFLEPVGESQVVEVLQCGTGDLVRSTTLPTRG